jgi:hypothetical protein
MRHNRFTGNFLLLIISFAVILVLPSCEKEVHINLGSSADHVVIQGQIETGQPPFVVLTSTIGFFSNVDLGTLEKSFLHNATVKVSNGAKTVTLKEYSIDTGVANKFYVYSLDTTNILANLLLGEVNKTYSLTVTYNGQTFTSVTTIPNPKGVDSMWFETPEFKNSKTPDNANQLFVNYNDPDTPGNYVRCFVQKGHGQFYPAGIFSDEAVNGKKINKIGLFAGYDKTATTNGDSLRYFYPGDSVTLKWSEIDKAVFKFWNSYEFAQNSVGNPFATPINLVTNISNGGLGVWAGYGTTFKTLVVPH